MKIVVVGAGIAGLSIGWRLAQSGAEVSVIERAQPGGGATLAAGGMIAPTPENGDENSAQARLGRASAALWPAFAAEIEQTSGRPIGFRRQGTLLIARTAEENARLAIRANSISSAKILSPAEARALEPMLDATIAGALFDPNDAQVDNRAVGRALALAFVRAGGSLQTNETIVRIEVAKDRIVAAISPFQHYHADAYILAAGAWTARLEGLPPAIVPPVVPVKGEMISLEPRGSLPGHIVWGNEVYLVPRHDRLFVGATLTRNGYDTSLTDEAEAWLRGRAIGLMPALADWQVDEHWAGLRPGSPDDLPILGPTALDGLFVASGQFRNGILYAPAMAEALRSLILERRSSIDIAAFDPRRFTDPSFA
jgi:glycine oxidase